ncbi:MULTISPECIES: CoA ester lyase [unclassified Uliginosibacterium]|uniref:HpcH/HpaI aldolase/citrate lyase family protein n=1 Tax=unclassified Uliginosibacterium TaxID=2621521 RepID=UPI000C7DB7CC|nr:MULTISPECIES: aldolase/citrate lyase family protein [unclassified Uliginosibacterium]MDO6386968.1 aldolase/citrate lyase family protein [Uliginosibacterium sp. 31-12]PLK49649.1 CoA ester lyase [Uliginosibacterium sp. TH139]
MSIASSRSHLPPDAVLYPEGSPLPRIPVVEHFAGNEKTMRKAMALQAERGAVFDITCDCEDGAPAGAEREHAEMIAALIMSSDNHFQRIGARIHDITHSAWRTDLEQIVGLAGPRLAYLVLPKVRGVSDVERVLVALREVAQQGGLEREIPLHVLIETHGALHQVWEIAALPGVETLDFGLMDFVSAHHGAIPASAMRSPGQFEHPLIVSAKSRIVSAALAHGVLPSHNVCTELVDMAVIENDARRARMEAGFLRMWSIHPNQIEPILRGMQPSEAEIGTAGEIILAAQDASWGPIRHHDRLHDRASYRYYWSVLKRARATGITLQDEVLKRLFA